VVALPQPRRTQHAAIEFPFHELPNVLMTPHCSSATDGARDRRLSDVASNIDRFVRGEALRNFVLTT
jgi:phosphoglycerate dehydrogenase-like enzyme